MDVELIAEPDAQRLRIEARTGAHARTGVEMEALTAVAAAGLTVYDMCKGVDRSMTLDAVHLVSKRGGKSGVWERGDDPLTTSPAGDRITRDR